MLSGRVRRKKMRDRNQLNNAEDPFEENPSRNSTSNRSTSTGGGVRFSIPPPETTTTSRRGRSRKNSPSEFTSNDAPLRRRSSHLADNATKEKLLENDSALKNEVSRLESTDSHWQHPMGFNLLSSLRVLNAATDPVLSNSGYWIQPEDPEDIPAMFDSYLNVNCLFYSLVGVLGMETSLWLPIPPEDAPEYAHWFIAISRFCWCASGVWSMAAVVASFHILWSIYATPTWAKRRFLMDNSRAISVVYALGAPNFALMMGGTITGVMGNVCTQPGFTKRDWISAAAGLALGVSVSLIFVLASGNLISKVVRPWKIADENLSEKKEKWSLLGRTVSQFFHNYEDTDYDNNRHSNNRGTATTAAASSSYSYSKEDPDGDLEIYDIEEAGFEDMELPFVAQKLCAAGFTLKLLQRVENEVLLDQLTKGAGVDKAGDRLRVILYVRDAPRAAAENIRMTSIVTGNMDQTMLDGSAYENRNSEIHGACVPKHGTWDI